jgi:hypothetical protein
MLSSELHVASELHLEWLPHGTPQHLAREAPQALGRSSLTPVSRDFLPEIERGRSTYLDEAGLRRANSPREILSQFGKILEFGKTRSAN